MANSSGQDNKNAGDDKAVSDAKEATAASAQDLQAEIEKLRGDVAELAKQLAATGSSTVDTARAAAQEGVEKLRAKGDEALDAARTNARAMEEELCSAVREKPLAAIAMAAAVGYLVAVISGR